MTADKREEKEHFDESDAPRDPPEQKEERETLIEALDRLGFTPDMLRGNTEEEKNESLRRLVHDLVAQGIIRIE